MVGDLYIWVRYDFIGWHRWPGAEGVRAYLSDLHRHKFFVECQIEVFHDDREVEFHDFLDFCKNVTPGGDLRSSSCETIGGRLLEEIKNKYPGRSVLVSVSEDNEVGGVIVYRRPS